MDPTKTFTASEVEDLTDINPETLRVWRRRGFIPANPGGGWARYDLPAVVLIATLLELTAYHRVDVSEAHDKFVRGAGEFFIREAAAAAVNGQPDVWVYVVFSRAQEASRSWTVRKTEDPTSMLQGLQSPRSVLAVNVGDIARQILARIERLEGGDDDDE